MGIIRRETIKTTGAMIMGMAIGLVNQVFLQTAVLLPEEIGLINAISSASMILMGLVTLGMPSVTVRFWPFLTEDTERDRFITFILMVPLAGFIATFAVLFLLKGSLMNLWYSDQPLMRTFYYLLVPITFYQAFFYILNFYSRNQLKTAVPNFIRDVVFRLFYAALLVLLIFLVIDFETFMNLFGIIHLVVLLLVFLYVNSVRKIRIKFGKPMLNPELKKQIPAYAGYSFMTVVGTFMMGNIDRVMLSFMDTLSGTGVYSIAFFMGSVIDAPVRSMIQISEPVYAKAFRENNMEKVRDVYSKSCLTLLIVAVIAVVGIWINVDNIFGIIPKGEIYADGKYVVLFIALGKFFKMALGTSPSLLRNSKYFRVNFYALITLASLAVITNLIFIPIMGIEGAAVASCLSILVYVLIQYFFIWFKIGLQPFTSKNLLTILIGFAILLLNHWLPVLDNHILDLFYRSAIVTVVYGSLVLALRLSEEINNAVFGFLGISDPFDRK